MARKVDKEKKQAELLETAITVFAKRGYQATTMDEIAECAGVSKGMLYIYFKNKEALFGAVFRWFGQMTGVMMQEAISTTDNEKQQLLRIADVWTEVVTQYRDYVPLFLDFWAAASVRGMRSDYADDLARMYDEYRTLIASIIKRGIKKGHFHQKTDAQAVAYLMVGGMDGLYIQSWLSQPKDPGKLIRHAMQTVIEGISRK